jgi:hypothetical protein
MKEILLSSLSIAYAVAGLICIVAYFPTISDLYLRKKNSANPTTYALWTTTAIISVLYSIFALEDLLFLIFSILNMVSCTIILILSWKRTCH